MSKKTVLVAAAAALGAGAVNGIFGAGGGIVLVFALEKLLSGDALKGAIQCTLACMLCMSVTSAVIYMINGHVEFSQSSIYLIPSLIGGVLGGVLLKRINSKLLYRIFCIFVIIAGIRTVI